MKSNDWIINHPYKMALFSSIFCCLCAILICYPIEDVTKFIICLPIIFIWNYTFALFSWISEKRKVSKANEKAHLF